WPNPPWSTFLLRKLLESPQFRDELIQRFAAHVNTTFLPERVLATIDRLKANLEPEMTRTISRWGGILDEMMGFAFPASITEWETNIEVMKTFAVRRPVYIRQHINDFFDLNGTFQLRINVFAPDGGKVTVNGVVIPPGPFTGVFFKDVPLRLNVIPGKGYSFVRWEGMPGTNLSGIDRSAGSISVRLREDTVINAIFVKR
ncbi:MAG: hypothetical protein GY940_26500, partial [bacterium]|nr:hypothetical protein [bacterium]